MFPDRVLQVPNIQKQRWGGSGRESNKGGWGEHTIRVVLSDKSVQGEAGGNMTRAEIMHLRYGGPPPSEMKYFYLY